METFNESVFLTLTDESKERVEHIYYIASMLKRLKLSPLNTKDFDRLYDMDMCDLRRLSGLPAIFHDCMLV
jgi:hypothetical protein